MHLKQPPGSVTAECIAVADTERGERADLHDMRTAGHGRTGDALLQILLRPDVRRPKIHRVAAVIEQHLQRAASARGLVQPILHRGQGLRCEHDARAIGSASVEQALLAVLRAG